MAELKKALEELKKQKKRKFDQTVEFIVNLKKFNPRKDAVNLVVNVPHKIKEKKICAFLEKKSDLVDTIIQKDFEKYSINKKALKKLVKKYDSFIAFAKLMPAVATNFGRVLGPAGKMPSPRLGILPKEEDKIITSTLNKINSTAKVKTREQACIKVVVGKESMKDEDIIDNVKAIYKEILNTLPNKKENIKSSLIKLTMTKPIKVEIK